MGRHTLDEDKKKMMMQEIIISTEKIILEEGLNKVTIRRVSKESGYSGATLYTFFRNRDELILYASIGCLKDYCTKLTEALEKDENISPLETYLITWTFFSEYSFKFPKLARTIFFSPESKNLKNVLKVYHEIFPAYFDGYGDNIKRMMTGGTLLERNYAVLEPILRGKVSDEKLELINELTVSYYFYLLENDLEKPWEINQKKVVSMCNRLVEENIKIC